jgi:hypothetical protein
MSPQHPDGEDALEHATVELFSEFDWETVNAYSETFPAGVLGRENAAELVLRSRLRPALASPGLPQPRAASDRDHRTVPQICSGSCLRVHTGAGLRPAPPESGRARRNGPRGRLPRGPLAFLPSTSRARRREAR